MSRASCDADGWDKCRCELRKQISVSSLAADSDWNTFVSTRVGTPQALMPATDWAQAIYSGKAASRHIDASWTCPLCMD